MYSDIVPPKKNKSSKLGKIKPEEHEVKILRDEPVFTGREIYHTVDGKDRRSKLPIVVIVLMLLSFVVAYYSLFNNKTTISFESKLTIFEIKDTIPMILSEKNQNASSTLSYNLIYNNEVKDRNIFAPTVEESTSTLAKVASTGDFYTLNTSTTSPFASIKVKLINESKVNVQVIKDTRFDVNGTTYYLGAAVNIKPTPKNASSTALSKYKVIGFRGTSNYETFYATDYMSEVVNVPENKTTADATGANIPNSDILSLIPENFISLKKSYVFDNRLNQSALVVINKRDFERVLIAQSGIVQGYVESLRPLADLLEYEISINDYDMVLDASTGLPTAFKSLTIEIKPKVRKDKVASTFKGFSKDTMRKIRNDISKNIEMEISFSPFWVSKVSDVDHISVEVK